MWHAAAQPVSRADRLQGALASDCSPKTFGRPMMFLAAIGALFITCGAFATFVVSLIVGAPLKFGKLSMAVLAALVSSGLAASVALAALSPTQCRGENCAGGDGWGFMEGGLVLAAAWLIVYSVTYIAVAFAVARYQARAQ